MDGFLIASSALGLSDDQAYHFTRVARKAAEIPELKRAIDQGVVKLSQARRILKVLTPETKTLWLEKAATLKQRELEREVARVNPQAAVPERIKPLSGELSELRCSLHRDVEELLLRAREVESQRSGKAAEIADVLSDGLSATATSRFPSQDRLSPPVSATRCTFGTKAGVPTPAVAVSGGLISITWCPDLKGALMTSVI